MKFKCYMCGSNVAEVIADKESMRFGCYGENKVIVRCLKCQLIQLFPQWEDHELDKLYSNYSKKEDFPGQKRKAKVSKYLKKLVSGDILEVGFGWGDNLRYLRKCGFKMFGIDKEYSFAWEDYKPALNYDTIYAIHFLEHEKDPLKFIDWMLEHLAQNGKFILEIPCVDDPLLKLYKNKPFQKFYWYPYHHFFFGYKTAVSLMGRVWVRNGCNVKVIRRQEYGIINHLRWLLRGKPGNWNPHIPVLDSIYKYILTKNGYSDTLVMVGTNV